MRDLLVITPSRGRPQRLADMLHACLTLSEADTCIAVCVDPDDEYLDGYLAVLSDYQGDGRVRRLIGPRRMNLTQWTNRVAADYAGDYRALASLGDDHVPRTPGWDATLLHALEGVGGVGIAYGDDLHQGARLPTAPVISAAIVQALGWMCEPSLAHMFVDDVWRDLGAGADCLVFVPEVVIEHVHPDAGKAESDRTYAGSLDGIESDRQKYVRWLQDRSGADVARISELRVGGDKTDA